MTIAVVSMIRDPWGGSEELWAQFAMEAIADGHRILHIGYETPTVHPKMIALQNAGVKRYTRPGYIKPGSTSISLFTQIGINYLRKKIRNPFRPIFDAKPDVVIYNGTCYSIASEKELIKALKHSHADFYIIGHLNSDRLRDITDQQAAIIVEAYNMAKTVFFVSERNKSTAERHLCTTINNAALLRNPVNLTDTTPVAFPSLNDGVKMAVVANLATVHKGQDILIEALSSDIWQSRAWHLNIYGTGYDESYLKNLVARFELQDKVTFHGRVNDIRKVWEENHLLVLPSHMEGMPLAVVEAMMCARVCVVTDVGGNSEWIKDGETGFIAPAATVKILRQTLEKAWNGKDRWEQMGVHAHQRAMSLYDPRPGITLLNQLKKQHAK